MAHDHHHAPDLSAGNLTGSSLAMHARNSTILAFLGIGFGTWIGFRSGDTAHFARTYLVCMMFALAICLGALFFVIVQHLTRAGGELLSGLFARTITDLLPAATP